MTYVLLTAPFYSEEPEDSEMGRLVCVTGTTPSKRESGAPRKRTDDAYGKIPACIQHGYEPQERIRAARPLLASRQRDLGMKIRLMMFKGVISLPQVIVQFWSF